MDKWKIIRARIVFHIAACLGVPMKIRDEYWSRAPKAKPVIGDGGNTPCSPLKAGDELNNQQAIVGVN